MERDTLCGRTLGQYQVVERIGAGAAAIVYKAYHEKLALYVALKVLTPACARDETFVQRFEREARAAIQLQHRNVIRVYDAGEVLGYHYMAMEYIDGGSLEDRLDAQPGQPLPQAAALDLGKQIGRALEYIHAQGLVHRDVKPSNILIDREGRAVLSDLGIVKRTAGKSPSTDGQAITGTPRYMSPEQAQGQPVDGRADLYALGVVLYEMLTGRPPFAAEESWALLHQHITATPQPLRSLNPDVPPWLEAVVLKALAKNPADRYQTATEWLQDIRGPTPATPQPQGDRASRGLRSIVPVIAAGGIIVALVGVVCLGVLLASPPGTPTPAVTRGAPPTSLPTSPTGPASPAGPTSTIAPTPAWTVGPTAALSPTETAMTPASPRYRAPALLGPPDETAFEGPNAQIVLSWQSAGTLKGDEWYVAVIEYPHQGKMWRDEQWTKDTTFRVPKYLHDPTLLTDDRRCAWHVEVRRDTGERDSNGHKTGGTPLSPPSASRHFVWRE